MKNEHLEDLCVITGGTRGIGSVIANKFRKEDRNVLAVSREGIDFPGHLEIELSEEGEIHQSKQELQLATAGSIHSI